jgi:dipeptidase E
MNLLLISNSTNAGETYLGHAIQPIGRFLDGRVKRIVFIPYAGVTVSWDQLSEKAAQRFGEIGVAVDPIHHFPDPVKAILEAEAIVVSGGNTFRLVQQIHLNGLVAPVREKVIAGTPYIGWSAGSNVACPTLRTTNDMPIIEPPSFSGLHLIPFQINPHYLDTHPEGHAGETREDRIREFLELNPGMYVAGLREGTMFQLTEGKLELIGNRPCRIFKYGEEPKELSAGDDFRFLFL